MTEIILEKHYTQKGKYLGKTVISRDTLLMKVKDVFPDKLDSIPSQFHEMAFIAWIKTDKDDRLGYKKHHQKLKDEGFDV